MAGNERFPLPNQTWYDPENPGALHDALRRDFARTRAEVERRPSLRRHVESCSICRTIAAAAGDAPPPTAARKRIKLIIRPADMHRLLGLPASFEIVHMFAADDPNAVSVLVAGEGLPEADPDRETPVVSPDAVTARTTNRTS